MQFAPKYRRSFVRYLLVAVAIVSVMPCLSLFTATALADPAVTIPDDNLRAALEQKLVKGEGDPITEAELAGLTEFITGHRSITDLTGLELCINLEYLDLASNAIIDISPLSELTNLQDLRIQHNTISDISALAELNKLTMLSLKSNNISDISALASLTELKWLGLYNNSIIDISALASLASLTSLEYLNLYKNELNHAAYAVHIPALENGGIPVQYDSDALAAIIVDDNLRMALEAKIKRNEEHGRQTELANLRELVAFSKSITDLTGLERCTNLVYLHLDNNEISDISPLAALTKLTHLYLENNSISDISALTELKELEYVYLKGNDLNSAAYAVHIPALQARGEYAWKPPPTVIVTYDLDSVTIPDENLRTALEAALEATLDKRSTRVRRLANLTQLVVSNKSITDLTGIELCTNLTNLTLTSNEISDISALAGLANLKYLYLDDNKISDISSLAELTNLQQLYLNGNKISDISVLAELGNLRELSLNGNFTISDISVLAELGNLKYLYLDANTIIDISPLAELGNLRELSLNGNFTISDISPLASLKNLVRLDLRSNALNSAAYAVHIPALEDNDVTVHYDPAVVIPDEHLRVALEAALGKSAGAPIAEFELANLTQLVASGRSITDLTGIELCTNLEGLFLNGNKISDISTLTLLTNLESLYLKGNELNSAAYSIHVPALQANGTIVEYDPAPLVTIPDEHLRVALEVALDKSAGGPIAEFELYLAPHEIAL